MKKILNISVIAALAILPMAANAAPVNGEPTTLGDNPPGGQTAQNVTASAAPKYQLAEANNAVDGVVATAGYVKGAYNAAIKAINKVSETANSAVQSVTEGTTNGTVAVNGTDVAVHGLGSAAYTDSTAYDAAGAASTAETNAKNYADGLANNYATAAQGAKADTAVQTVTTGDATSGNGTIKVDGTAVSVYGLGSAAYTPSTDYATAAQGAKADTALQAADLATYAKKTGVEKTAAAAVNGATVTYSLAGLGTTTATVTGTVPVVDTWGATAPAATGVSVDLANNTVVTGLTGNTANNTATISAGTVTYTEQ